MNKEKEIKVLTFIAFVVSIIAISIAYAAMSKDLVIIKENNVGVWDIHFANLSKPVLTGDATIKKEPKLYATHIGNFEISLTKPGDSVTYEFDIVNSGTLNAKIFFYNEKSRMCDFNYKYTHCDWNGNGINDTSDIEKIDKNIKYTLTYSDNGKSIKVGDKLNSKQKRHVILKVEYDINSSELPQGYVYLDNLDKVIQYVQVR